MDEQYASVVTELYVSVSRPILRDRKGRPDTGGASGWFQDLKQARDELLKDD